MLAHLLVPLSRNLAILRPPKIVHRHLLDLGQVKERFRERDFVRPATDRCISRSIPVSACWGGVEIRLLRWDDDGLPAQRLGRPLLTSGRRRRRRYNRYLCRSFSGLIRKEEHVPVART